MSNLKLDIQENEMAQRMNKISRQEMES